MDWNDLVYDGSEIDCGKYRAEGTDNKYVYIYFYNGEGFWIYDGNFEFEFYAIGFQILENLCKFELKCELRQYDADCNEGEWGRWHADRRGRREATHPEIE